MSVKTQKRRIARARAKAPQVGPYAVRKLYLIAEVDFLTETGAVRDSARTEPKMVPESEFTDWHWDWMRKGDLMPVNRPVPKEKKATA